MDKRSLFAIERIISCINELGILTKNKTMEYFYDSFEMNALLELLNEIEVNINTVNKKIKDKYKNIDWEIIGKEKEYDELFEESLNLGKVWELSSCSLKNELLNNLFILLEQELPIYYKTLCNKNHEKFAKKADL